MSEGVKSPGVGSRGPSWIRSPQDFWGGLVLIGFSLFALYASYDLPGMTASTRSLCVRTRRPPAAT